MAKTNKTKTYYRRLAIEIAEEEMRAQCAHICDALESYVDAELSDEDARGLYPRVWAHLLGCAPCREAYELMLASPEEEE